MSTITSPQQTIRKIDAYTEALQTLHIFKAQIGVGNDIILLPSPGYIHVRNSIHRINNSPMLHSLLLAANSLHALYVP